MRIKLIITALMLMASMVGMAQSIPVTTDSIRNAEYREKIGIDMTVPDFETKKIDAKVMGPRLAKILTKIQEDYTQQTNLNVLSIIQSNQIEGLSYGRIKSMKLDKVSKNDNEITICFNTVLEPNNLNLKRSQLRFIIIDGVSDDMATNDLFINICRYIKE